MRSEFRSKFGRKTGLAAVSVVLVSAAAAGAGADDAMPKRLACSFGAGTVSIYNKGAFGNAQAEVLAFELADIDVEGQSAKIVARAGAPPGTVRIVRAVNANHFLEVANEGFLNLTTVYDRDPATGGHPAVHSRHLGLLGQPIYGQYTGSCRPD